MAIALRGSGVTNSATTATTIELDFTSNSVQENDLLICAVIGGGTQDQWADETGWTKALNLFTGLNGALFYRLAPSSFTTVTFDFSGGAGNMSGAGIALSGVDTTNTIQLISMKDYFTGTGPTPQPVNAYAENSWAVLCGWVDDAGSDLDATWVPSGYTSAALNNAQDPGSCIGYKSLGTGTIPIAETPGACTLLNSEQSAWAMIVVTNSGESFGGGGNANLLAGKL